MMIEIDIYRLLNGYGMPRARIDTPSAAVPNASEGLPIRACGVITFFIRYLRIVAATQRVIKMLLKIEKGGNEIFC